MKITPALEYEKIRQDLESWNKVILHREGKFYRAYEWSAWIIKTVVCTEAFQKERGDAKMLTCNRYKNKNGEYVLLGFPVESFSKYVPVYKDVKKMEEGDDLMIEIEMPFTGEYTHQIFERTFIEDSYSCIQGRGTHYGIERLKMHIRQESHNYSRKCYAMSLDIRGYFMHIDRKILLDIVTEKLRRMATHRVNVGSPVKWGDIRDIDFLCWLSGEIIMLDPKKSCKIVGRESDWIGLDKNKSLFHTPDGCGLPIGNLTSQLLSNVYLNEFDQFMKRDLTCRHYGRYVDDAYVVSCDKQWLLSLIPSIQDFLHERLHLDIHRGKTQIHDVKYGVEFLGGFVKPYRTYMSNGALIRMRRNVRYLPKHNPDKLFRSVNAFLGVLAHHDAFKLRKELLENELTLKFGYFDRDMKVYTLKNT